MINLALITINSVFFTKYFIKNYLKILKIKRVFTKKTALIIEIEIELKLNLLAH